MLHARDRHGTGQHNQNDPQSRNKREFTTIRAVHPIDDGAIAPTDDLWAFTDELLVVGRLGEVLCARVPMPRPRPMSDDRAL